MKLYILGCGGWIPGENETSCFLMEYKEQLIMLDAGTGVSNLKNYVDILQKYDTLSIILTHYHLDHLIGLIYLLPYIKGKKLNIYGPGRPIYEKSTETYLKELLRTEFFSRPLDKFSDCVKCIDYGGENFMIGNISIEIVEQQHSSPSFRIGIDDKVIYATDTAFCEKEWENCRNAKILLHECWKIEDEGKSKHTSLDALINGLPLDKFEKILLIHHNPEWSIKEIMEIEERGKQHGIEIASDGAVYKV